VPHRQLDPLVIPSVIGDLHERVFALPEVEPRESLLVPGATAIWIRPDILIGRPECIVAGREVAHIHLDGSLHAVLPLGLIPDAESAGWVEPHPWAGVQPGFEAFVLIFSPRSSEEVDVAFDLVVEGLRFVTDG
jgi:phospholipase/carboxylesterase